MFVPENQSVPAGLPALISFPRTGSHWLRMALELYFDRPMLTRHFFEHSSDRVLLWHGHDKGLDYSATGPVIYLYRGPVDVVFSELTFRYGEGAVDAAGAVVDDVAEHYRRHLRRWLLGEGRDGKRPGAVIAYEWMLDRPLEALRPVVELLIDAGASLDAARLEWAWGRVTPSEVLDRTAYLSEVMDRAAHKELRRALFRYRHGGRVLARFRGDRELAGAMDGRLLET